MPQPLSENPNTLTDEDHTHRTIQSGKVTSTMSHKRDFAMVGNQERMVGGADKGKGKGAGKGGGNAAAKHDIGRKASTAGGDGKITPPGGPCCFCASYATGSTGDKKVDEMIDYVLQNLQEAGKALTNLGENFEHDLKLMFVDIMARVQHWVSVVQNRLDAAKADLGELRKELIARACDLAAKERELAELRAKLEECEAAKAACEKLIKTETNKPIPVASPPKTDKPAENLATEPGRVPQTGAAPAAAPSVAPPAAPGAAPPAAPGAAPPAAPGAAPPAAPGVLRPETSAFVNTACQSGKDRDRAKKEAELENEIARLRKENERIMKERAEYENAIQRALLRGVSSLNVEALKVLRCPPIPCCTPCGPCPPCSDSTEPVVACSPRVMKDNATPMTNRGSNAIPRNNSVNGNNGKTGAVPCCPVPKPPCSSACCAGSRGKNSPEDSMVFLLHQGDAGNLCPPCLPQSPRPCGSPTGRGNIVCIGGKCGKSVGSSTKDKFSCTPKARGSLQRSSDMYVRHGNGNGFENVNCAGKESSGSDRNGGAVKRDNICAGVCGLRPQTAVASKRCEPCSRDRRHRRED